MKSVNLAEKLALFSEPFQPRAGNVTPTGTPNSGDPATAAPRRVV
jgi:hypothetical protein